MITFDRKEREIWQISEDLFEYLEKFENLPYVAHRNDKNFNWLHLTPEKADALSNHSFPKCQSEYEDFLQLIDEENYDVIYITWLDFDDEHYQDL